MSDAVEPRYKDGDTPVGYVADKLEEIRGNVSSGADDYTAAVVELRLLADAMEQHERDADTREADPHPLEWPGDRVARIRQARWGTRAEDA